MSDDRWRVGERRVTQQYLTDGIAEPPEVSKAFPAQLEEWDGKAWRSRGTATSPAAVRKFLGRE